MNQEDIKNRKKEIRRQIREIKRTFSLEAAAIESENIFNQVEALPQFNSAKVVLVYWSLSDEVDTIKFIHKWESNKRIVLPIVVGKVLELRAFNGIENLVISRSFGIKEPQTGELVNPRDVDFAIIPGIAFDIKGNRLGRGKGFYDQFLKQTKAYKVAVGFSFQVLEVVPVSSHDVPVDIVVTTKNGWL